MKKKETHDIDQLFSERLGDLKATPSLSAWDALEEQLDQRDAKEKTKTRKILLWRTMTGVAACLVLGLTIGLWPDMKNPGGGQANGDTKANHLITPVAKKPTFETNMSQPKAPATIAKSNTFETATVKTTLAKQQAQPKIQLAKANASSADELRLENKQAAQKPSASVAIATAAKIETLKKQPETIAVAQQPIQEKASEQESIASTAQIKTVATAEIPTTTTEMSASAPKEKATTTQQVTKAPQGAVVITYIASNYTAPRSERKRKPTLKEFLGGKRRNDANAKRRRNRRNRNVR
ncbi:hypothetical protein FUAX_08640 [Fulvitalea axinellae]|uniref:Uncharacterized protein n=1 Tax=Fulvitalea axinellae TaxID=1182444 RepID=A0AAU9CNC9_9BACT|nr:hypothetical protein FUAX_08640 [Fulvitalea axinellae]